MTDTVCKSCGKRHYFPDLPDIYIEFIDDMIHAGIPVHEYHGRSDYHGPAVSTDEKTFPTIHDVMSATRIEMDIDDFHSNLVVYPKRDGIQLFKDNLIAIGATLS